MISMCLPKGDAMSPLAELFDTIGFPLEAYHSENRTYRPEVKLDNGYVRAKIMAEKDVAIQIAAGNYDIGFCGMDWIQEHIVRYKATQLHVFKHLHLNKKKLYACTGLNSDLTTTEALKEINDFVVIVSEYPNLAENFAIQNRLKKFKVFSAWGSVEAYPPEHADVVILAADDEDRLQQMELQPIILLSDSKCKTYTTASYACLESDLCLIVNRKSFTEKNLSPILEFFQKTEGYLR